MERNLRKNESVRKLFEAIASLRDVDECARFLRDLCTVYELEAMAERWQVAQRVAEGIPYRKISEETGASTTTVTRIAHWVKYGEGGYRMMLDRMKRQKEAGPR